MSSGPDLLLDIDDVVEAAGDDSQLSWDLWRWMVFATESEFIRSESTN